MVTTCNLLPHALVSVGRGSQTRILNTMTTLSRTSFSALVLAGTLMSGLPVAAMAQDAAPTAAETASPAAPPAEVAAPSAATPAPAADAPAAEPAPAPVTPAVTAPAEPPAVAAPEANPYGLGALWSNGDVIARGVLLIMLLMSLYMVHHDYEIH